MRYAIIEDEAYSAELLQYSIQRLRPDYELVFKSSTIEDTVRMLKTKPQIDLMFLDIELADGNSFDIFKETEVSIPVIFTTSYNEYAIQAFKVHSIDYLLKPFSDDDLALAINKFERYYQQHDTHLVQQILQQLPSASARPQRIRIESGDNYRFVTDKEVSYFISEDKYVFAILKTGKRVMTSFTRLQDLEDMLPGSDFFRVSRNIVASIDSVQSVSKFFRGRLSVTLQAGDSTEHVMISSGRREDFLSWLGR